MKQKINVRLIGIAILAVLATLVCMTCVYYSLFQKQVRKDLKIQAQMLGEAEVFDDVSTPAKSFDIAKEDLRITWIDKDGTVLYDNDANTDIIRTFDAGSVIFGGTQAGFISLFGIKIAIPFHVGIHDDRNSMITNHSAGVIGSQVPHGVYPTFLMFLN